MNYKRYRYTISTSLMTKTEKEMYDKIDKVTFTMFDNDFGTTNITIDSIEDVKI